MSKKRSKYDEDFKKNAVQLSYASSRSVKEISADLGISEQLLYRWRKQYKEDGEPTEYSQMQAELKKLRLENAELKIQQDMLSKANGEKEKIKKIFDEGEGSYGPERICGIIRERGGHMGRDKCSRHMAAMGLNSVHNKRRIRSLTNSKKARGDRYPNLLRREYPIVSRMALSSDITYLRSGEGFEYLCIIKDVVSGEILGRCCAPRMTKELVINAFMGVLSRYGNELKESFIFHIGFIGVIVAANIHRRHLWN